MSTSPDAPSGASKPRHTESPSPKDGIDDEPTDDKLLDGEVKDDEYVGANGLRIKTGNISKEKWKKVQHKNRDPNGVCIPTDYDKPPIFK